VLNVKLGSVAPFKIVRVYIIRPRFEFMKVVTLMITFFWNVKACSLTKISRRFGRRYCLHLHGSLEHK